MPKATVDRRPPPLFRQGLTPLSKLLLLSALSVLLMVVDTRLQLGAPVRAAVATALTPLQWLALAPIRALQAGSGYLGSLQAAQQEASVARTELTRQVQRAAQVEHLGQENRELRALLGMRERLTVQAHGAEALYDSADPYTRKLVIDRGEAQGIKPGSPVMDGYGVLGQVTRVYPLVSEVTLLTDRDQAIPVLNTRTGQRSVAYGQPRQGLLELRFIAASADLEVGDLLTTSGVDGIYPPGLPVAHVHSITHQGDGGYARVLCEPMARPEHSLQLLVLEPLNDKLLRSPEGSKR
ncbi:MAG: rod shape-determining protein MreC [Burkholderiales bacterium]|nr:rod shape-determining protein MreC [Burkholderiales bacterium]